MKDISIVVAGNPEIKDITIQHGTTAKNVLMGIGLNGYVLFKECNEPPFCECENIYPFVENGQKLYVTIPADARASILPASLVVVRGIRKIKT